MVLIPAPRRKAAKRKLKEYTTSALAPEPSTMPPKGPEQAPGNQGSLLAAPGPGEWTGIGKSLALQRTSPKPPETAATTGAVKSGRGG